MRAYVCACMSACVCVSVFVCLRCVRECFNVSMGGACVLRQEERMNGAAICLIAGVERGRTGARAPALRRRRTVKASQPP